MFGDKAAFDYVQPILLLLKLNDKILESGLTEIKK
jgi:hypothetical protein